MTTRCSPTDAELWEQHYGAMLWQLSAPLHLAVQVRLL